MSRLAAAVVTLLAVLLAGLALGWAMFRPHPQKQRAVVAEATAQAVDRAAVRTVEVTVKTEEAARAVEQAPGADAPLSPAVRDLHRAGIEQLRHPPAARP